MWLSGPRLRPLNATQTDDPVRPGGRLGRCGYGRHRLPCRRQRLGVGADRGDVVAVPAVDATDHGPDALRGLGQAPGEIRAEPSRPQRLEFGSDDPAVQRGSQCLGDRLVPGPAGVVGLLGVTLPGPVQLGRLLPDRGFDLADVSAARGARAHSRAFRQRGHPGFARAGQPVHQPPARLLDLVRGGVRGQMRGEHRRLPPGRHGGVDRRGEHGTLRASERQRPGHGVEHQPRGLRLGGRLRGGAKGTRTTTPGRWFRCWCLAGARGGGGVFRLVVLGLSSGPLGRTTEVRWGGLR
nr:hypothetical protein [Frankia sp. ArI3]